MEIKFVVTKEERKALVKTIGAFVGWEPVYKGAPSFAFAVQNYIIDRYGTLIYDERTNEEDVQRLLAHLSSEGFVRDWHNDLESNSVYAHDEDAQTDSVSDEAPKEENTSDEATEAFVDSANTETSALKTIIIDIPFFNDTALNNLRKLIEGKASLIKKSIGVDDLAVVVIGGAVHFNWFSPDSTELELEAYKKFVSALCLTAKNQKRVTMSESAVESEKYAFRCFLLKLGFIGTEYASAREILLSKLSGNSSFRSGDHKSRSASKKTVTADNGSITVHSSGYITDDADLREDDNGANTPETDMDEVIPERCGDCRYHCYYTDGDMRTSTGEIVDTSARKLGQYTHYCLKAPSGCRRIKHAVDWSGTEVPPSWCPLKSSVNAEV